MKRIAILLLMWCSVSSYSQQIDSNGLFVGIQGLGLTLFHGSMGYEYRLNTSVCLRESANLAYIYQYPDSAGIAQPSYSNLAASVSSDILFEYTKTLVVPFIGVGLNGGVQDLGNVIAGGGGSSVYSIALYVPFGFDYAISANLRLSIEDRVQLGFEDAYLGKTTINVSLSSPELEFSFWF